MTCKICQLFCKCFGTLYLCHVWSSFETTKLKLNYLNNYSQCHRKNCLATVKKVDPIHHRKSIANNFIRVHIVVLQYLPSLNWADYQLNELPYLIKFA